MLLKFFFSFIAIVSATNNPSVVDSKKLNTSNSQDVFRQNVKMYFYDNLNQCLNNGDSLLVDNSYYNTDCNCLNSTGCLNKLFRSNNFRNNHWNINNTRVNGSQCNFKKGRICDTCGDYTVRTNVILYGVNCNNIKIGYFFITIFIICLGLSFLLMIVYCIQAMIKNPDGYKLVRRRRYGYTKIINEDNIPGNPPSYN